MTSEHFCVLNTSIHENIIFQKGDILKNIFSNVPSMVEWVNVHASDVMSEYCVIGECRYVWAYALIKIINI